MEPRKYSTGTKGRLKMHADQCRDAIHANTPNHPLATEFIETLDPQCDDRAWQRFESPDAVLPVLRAWLAGEELPAAGESQRPRVVPASRLKPDQKLDAALREAREWVDQNRDRLSMLPALEAIEEVLGRLGRPG